MSQCLEILTDLALFIWNVFCCLFKAFLKWFKPKSCKSLNNEIVLITGGNRGIGKCIAMQLTHCKPKQIILWGKCTESLKHTAQEITDTGVPCLYMYCDVSKKENIYKKAQEVKETVGDVTILINNAGVVFGKNVIDSNDSEIVETFEVNIMSHFWTIKAFLPHMFATNHGHIVTMSSVVGLLAVPGFAEYCASKFAATGLLETLLYELNVAGKDGVHTTSVHPYLVDTDMFAGCSTRFPWLFPALKQSYVARKTVDAILTNQKMLVMPRIMYFFLFLKSFLPVEAILLAQKFTGVDKTLDGFLKAKNEKTK